MSATMTCNPPTPLKWLRVRDDLGYPDGYRAPVPGELSLDGGWWRVALAATQATEPCSVCAREEPLPDAHRTPVDTDRQSGPWASFVVGLDAPDELNWHFLPRIMTCSRSHAFAAARDLPRTWTQVADHYAAKSRANENGLGALFLGYADRARERAVFAAHRAHILERLGGTAQHVAFAILDAGYYGTSDDLVAAANAAVNDTAHPNHTEGQQP